MKLPTKVNLYQQDSAEGKLEQEGADGKITLQYIQTVAIFIGHCIRYSST